MDTPVVTQNTRHKTSCLVELELVNEHHLAYEKRKHVQPSF